MSPINEKYKNIFLIGFMGAGKTTVGKILSEKIGFRYFDADKFIENQSGKSISDIFSEHGEDYFRGLETKSLEYIVTMEDQVIATGGGVVTREENWEIMRKSGVTIYLKAPVEVIWERIQHNKSRPLLQVENPLDTAKQILNSRTHLYEQADIIIETADLSPDQVSEEIINISR